MRRDEAIARIRKHEVALRSKGATGLLLFGSLARDEATDRSDVDVIVEYDRERGFAPWGFPGIAVILEDELKRSIDVTTPKSLHPKLKERILAEARRIFR